MNFKKMRIVELKEECKRRNLKVSGNKDELIRRLKKYETDRRREEHTILEKQEIEHKAQIKTKTIIMDRRIRMGLQPKMNIPRQSSKSHFVNGNEQQENLSNLKKNAQEIEHNTDKVFKMLELLDKIQGEEKLHKTHPISILRMKCYKQLLGIIASVLILTDDKKDDENYKERRILIDELRKYAESNKNKIIDSDDEDDGDNETPSSPKQDNRKSMNDNWGDNPEFNINININLSNDP